MYLSKLEIAISSPAVWTLVAIFVFNGLQALAPILSGTAAEIVNAVLLVLTGFLHTSHVQSVASGV